MPRRPNTCANHTVPYGTALLGGVVPGTSCQATIAPSLRDKSHSPIEGPRIKLALMGLNPWAELYSPFVGLAGQQIVSNNPYLRHSTWAKLSWALRAKKGLLTKAPLSPLSPLADH
jgi:hypothetical protein